MITIEEADPAEGAADHRRSPVAGQAFWTQAEDRAGEREDRRISIEVPAVAPAAVC
ncbi:hypothetical protein ACFU7T_11035 [Streptomyces sp. NPDC057555]|uniref:hypothetical protein n=1 Tax=Streptomyces sp. NPDC057555 TaxID=3346166 RepID=UPI0036AD4CC4